MRESAESVEVTKARELFVDEMLAAYSASSGVVINDERHNWFVSEMNLRRVTGKQMLLAREWIIRGRPAMYGVLSLADFFPTPEQLKEIEFDLTAALQKEHDRGEKNGIEIGRGATWRELQDEMTALRNRKCPSCENPLDATAAEYYESQQKYVDELRDENKTLKRELFIRQSKCKRLETEVETLNKIIHELKGK